MSILNTDDFIKGGGPFMGLKKRRKIKMKFDTKHYMSAGFLPKDMEKLQSHFPNLKEYGGYIENINGLRELFENEFLSYLLWSNAHQLLLTEHDINKVFTKEMLDYIKNTIKVYYELTNDSIYKDLIEKYNWNE